MLRDCHAVPCNTANLELKTQPKHLLGSPQLDIGPPYLNDYVCQCLMNNLLPKQINYPKNIFWYRNNLSSV